MKKLFILSLLLILVACSNNEKDNKLCSKLKFDDINVFKTHTIIQIPDIVKGKVKGTGSMLPTVYPDSIILYKKPNNENDICIGDIVYYIGNIDNCDSSWLKNSSAIIHRVKKIKNDEKGIYYIVNGDNNGLFYDPCKIRFGDIKYVVIGVLY